MALNIPKTAAKPTTQSAVTEDTNEQGNLFLEEADAPEQAQASNDPEQVQTSQEAAPVRASVPAVTNANLTLGHRHDDDGFGASMDADIGFGSFPIIKLDGNVLSCESGEFDHLVVRAIRAQSKYLIKARTSNEDGVPFVYSYDNVIGLDGRSISDHCREWVEDGEMQAGSDPVISEYRELIVEVVSGADELTGEIVILNVSPGSRARLAGYNASLKLRGKDITQVHTLVKAGPKLSKGKNSWYPWSFSEAV